MHCTQCSHSISADDKFCAKCGHPVSRQQTHHKPRAPFSNPAGVAGYAALVAEKEKVAARRWTVLTGIYLVVAGIVGLSSGASHNSGGTAIVMSYVIGLIPLVIVGQLLTNKLVSSAEYYALAGARGAGGDHQCIHCGNRGVYVQGQYRTNLRHHSCTKCKSHLFTTLG